METGSPWRGDGPFDAREYLAVHLLPLVVGELALLALEMRDEPRDRVARVRHPERNFLPGTVIRLTLPFGVRAVTVRLALDQRGAFPARARATALLAASWTAKMSFPSTVARDAVAPGPAGHMGLACITICPVEAP